MWEGVRGQCRHECPTALIRLRIWSETTSRLDIGPSPERENEVVAATDVGQVFRVCLIRESVSRPAKYRQISSVWKSPLGAVLSD